MEAMVMFDVVEEILLRLPVKDLLRCKSVCKSWYSLISSPSFIKIHEKFICNKDHKNNKQLGNRRIAMIRKYTFTNGHHDALYIEGSSNGLVCIASIYNRLFLTNPSTREFRELHKPPKPILPKDVSYARCYGFGYDSSTDDYKLMAIKQRSDDGALVQILSLKSNIWKLFGHVNYSFYDCMPGILFNGALHWFSYNANDIARDKVLIVSFGLAKEEFIEIPQPDDTRYVGSHGSTLGIIEDRLCIFDTCDNGRPRGIWVIKNYNVKPSWELLPDDYEMKDNVVHHMKMITDCDHMKMTFFCDDNILLSGDVKYIESPIFVQTLVSPYSNNEKSSHTKNKNREVKVSSACFFTVFSENILYFD
ncbi:putative F-box domain-containing protein [Tanacetum coccineum]